jgi:hypothetical protein
MPRIPRSAGTQNRRYGALSVGLRRSEARKFDVTLRDPTPSQGRAHNPVDMRPEAYCSRAPRTHEMESSVCGACSRPSYHRARASPGSARRKPTGFRCRIVERRACPSPRTLRQLTRRRRPGQCRGCSSPTSPSCHARDVYDIRNVPQSKCAGPDADSGPGDGSPSPLGATPIRLRTRWRPGARRRRAPAVLVGYDGPPERGGPHPIQLERWPFALFLFDGSRSRFDQSGGHAVPHRRRRLGAGRTRPRCYQRPGPRHRAPPIWSASSSANGVTHAFLVPAVLQFMLAVPGVNDVTSRLCASSCTAHHRSQRRCWPHRSATFGCQFVQA